MNPSTAQSIFFSLFNALRENSFEEVGTFLIARYRENNIFYEDTRTALEELYQRAQNPDNALTAIRQLIYAARDYFRLASDLPVLFIKESQSIQQNTQQPIPQLNLFLENTDTPIDISQVLNNPELDRLQRILVMTAEFLGNNDRDFFINLNKSL